MKVCPKCARSFAEGFQFCPQDATELVKYDLRARLQAQDEFRFLIHHEPLHVRLRRELAEAVFEFKHNPRGFLKGLFRGEGNTRRRKRLLQTGIVSAVIAYGLMMLVGVLTGFFTPRSSEASKFEMPTSSQYPVLVVPIITAKQEAAESAARTNQGLLGGSLQQRQRAHGGGGASDQAPTSRGGAPTAALTQQVMKPDLRLPTVEHPTWIVTPTIYADPKSFLKIDGQIGLRNGQTETPSLGNGPGTGVGPGKGPGYGPGENGNTGDGKAKIGGGETTGPGNEVYQQTPDLHPTILFKERAKYTEEARQNRIQGTVVLSIIFGADGRIHDIRAVHSLPCGLTEEAMAVAQRIRFNPALRGGKPVSVRSTIEYNFALY
jgi:TonB family protein